MYRWVEVPAARNTLTRPLHDSRTYRDMTEVHQPQTMATRRSVLLGAGALGAGAIITACGGNQPGGTVLEAQDTVLTQPQAGQFKAFSATCTHQGCTVSDVSGGTINCPCHGSQYNIVDGSVVTGPASQPLPKKTVTLGGDTL